MSVVINAISKWYFGKLTNRLARTGLTYHDAVKETGVYNKAVSRLPADIQVARQRRIQRSMDLSAKHVDIPTNLREDPWREYKQVSEIFAITQMENDERKAINNLYWMPYHIGREAWHPYDTKKAWFWNNNKKATKKVGK